MSTASIETVLESVFGSYQVRAEIITRVQLCGAKAAEAPDMPHGLFHIMTEGDCWVSGPAMDAPVRLSTGDLIVFPAGNRHALSAAPSQDPDLPASETWMLCGKLEFVMAANSPLFSALPAHFVVRAADCSDSFRRITTLLTKTASQTGWGHQLMQNKLADTLFTMAICEYIHTDANPRGLLAGLADARLSKALAAIHERPGEEWTIQSLAGVAGMSRTAFADAFHHALGQPPILYLSTWRASQARILLKDRKCSVATIAQRMGYRSEAAFRRFYKRMEGVGPGQVRSASANKDGAQGVAPNRNRQSRGGPGLGVSR